MFRRPPYPHLFPYTTLFRSPPPFVHWVYFNIPGTTTSLPEGVPAVAKPPVPPGGVQGQNEFSDPASPTGANRVGYGGPCPDRKSTRLNSSHANISYAVFCLK